MLKFSTVFVSLPFVLTGCSVPTEVVYSGPPLQQRSINAATDPFVVLHSPSLDTVVTSELGNTLISRSYSQSTPALRITKPINHRTTNNGVPIHFEIPAGVLKRIGDDNKGNFYASDIFYRIYQNGNHSKAINKGGVYIPNDNASRPLIFWLPPSATRALVDKLYSPVSYEAAPPVISVSADNHKKELIYTGVSKNVITVLYREYQNDLARPAFSQELKYDLGEGRTIGFKGARFEVINATNLGITYKVRRYLD